MSAPTPPVHPGRGTLTVYVGPTVNCVFDTAGNCLYFYDPLFSFPTMVVPETTEYVFCHV